MFATGSLYLLLFFFVRSHALIQFGCAKMLTPVDRDEELQLLRKEVDDIKLSVARVERDTGILSKEVQSVREHVHWFTKEQEHAFFDLEHTVKHQLNQLRTDQNNQILNKLLSVLVIGTLFYLIAFY